MSNKENDDFVADPLSALCALLIFGALGGTIGAVLATITVVLGRPAIAALAKLFGAPLSTREMLLSLDPSVVAEPAFYVFFIIGTVIVLWFYLSNAKNVALLFAYIFIIGTIFLAIKGCEVLSNFASS